tara:strand:- start:193 stop:978 length:786 start_codon:yes stop_codon:yes gene_type:complete
MTVTHQPVCHAKEWETWIGIITSKYERMQDPATRVVVPLGHVEHFFVKPLAEYSPTIWIVSPGNSGSSLLHDYLGTCYYYPTMKSHSYHLKWQNKNCLKGIVEGGFLWEIEPQDKIIYLYSHPLNILFSFYQKINKEYEGWAGGNPHYVEYLECDTDEDFNDNYLYKDVLNLEKHLDKWWRQNDFDCLCIKYESLYDCQSVIEEFIGGVRKNESKLPPYRPRNTDWQKHSQREQLLKTYGTLVEKFKQKPDYELFLKENKR